MLTFPVKAAAARVPGLPWLTRHEEQTGGKHLAPEVGVQPQG
jgi:hypothetical protein